VTASEDGETDILVGRPVIEQYNLLAAISPLSTLMLNTKIAALWGVVVTTESNLTE
jgi:hypothetical protein